MKEMFLKIISYIVSIFSFCSKLFNLGQTNKRKDVKQRSVFKFKFITRRKKTMTLNFVMAKTDAIKLVEEIHEGKSLYLGANLHTDEGDIYISRDTRIDESAHNVQSLVDASTTITLFKSQEKPTTYLLEAVIEKIEAQIEKKEARDNEV